MDRQLFGKEFNRVHATKDKPAKWFGPSHRRFLHDPLSNAIIALMEYPEDPLRAYAAAMAHDYFDRMTTMGKRELTRKLRRRR